MSHSVDSNIQQRSILQAPTKIATMGFFFFVTKTVDVVRGLAVSHNPIIRGLGSLASIVTRMIPVVGPVLDCAIPALDEIFSHDSDSEMISDPSNPGILVTRTPDQDRQMSHGFETTFDAKLESMTLQTQAVYKAVSDLGRDIEGELQSISIQTKSRFDKLDAERRQDEYNKLYAILIEARQYFKLKESTFANMNDFSGPPVFASVLTADGNQSTIVSLAGKLKSGIIAVDTIFQVQGSSPTRALVDLFLFSVHWLLLYHKTIIVVLGIKCRAHQSKDETTQYISTIQKLHDAIEEVQADTNYIATLLRHLCERLLNERDSQIKSKIKSPLTIYLYDECPVLSIGWVSPQEINAKYLEVDTITAEFVPFPQPTVIAPVPVPDVNPPVVATPVPAPPTDEQLKQHEVAQLKAFEDTAAVAYYREAAILSLKAYLLPTTVVIESLERSMRNWRSRIPVQPMTEPKTPHVSPTVGSVVPRPKTMAEDKKRVSSLWGKRISYAVSYVTQFVEGPPATWTPPTEAVEEGVETVSLEFGPIQVRGDPTNDFGPVKLPNGEVQSQKGIKRRVYVTYSLSNQEAIYEFVTELAEDDQSFTHLITQIVNKAVME